MSFDWSAFIQTAKGETRERLQALNDGLLRLEEERDNAALIDEVFRHAHSIKGSAQMVGLDMIGRVAHSLENLLGAVRSGSLAIAPPLVDISFEALDAIQQLLEDTPDGSARERAEALIQRLELAVSGTFDTPEAAMPTPVPRAAATASSRPEAPEAPPREEDRRPPAEPEAAAAAPEAAAATTTADAGPAPEAAAATTTADAGPAPEAASLPAMDIMRVPAERVDRLLALVGELSLIEQRQRAITEALGELQTSLRSPLDAESAEPNGGQRAAGAGAQAAALAQRAHRLNTAYGWLVRELRDAAMDLRLLPVSTLFDRFPRHIRDLGRAAGKDVHFVVQGDETRLDKRVLDELYDPLLHLLRNAVDHATESVAERRQAGKPDAGTITLSAASRGRTVVIEVRDDGRGVDVRKVRRVACDRAFLTPTEAEALSQEQALQLLFRPGFSTAEVVTAVSGRGVGLDVVHANVSKLKGMVRIETAEGKGTTFALEIPLTLATTRVLLLECGGRTFAVPAALVRGALDVGPDDVQSVRGQPAVTWEGRTVPLFPLESALWGEAPVAARRRATVLLQNAGRVVGLMGDRLLDEEEVVLKPLGGLLRSARLASAGAIYADGRVALLLDVQAVVVIAERQKIRYQASGRPSPARRHTILLADDTITTRELERAILEAAGHEVVAVPDGEEAWGILARRRFDLVVADVEMPRMDGITLTRLITSDARTARTPVIIITSLSSDADRRRGLEAGAAAYIVKSAFNQENLLDLVERLIA
ncbi:MAG: hybrid sensor histidine kinase/response regulator [Armatimonadetes bacterium]|nr:hybrid sensor histidine kinase/response regulator [Armatimonadota bacterium]